MSIENIYLNSNLWERYYPLGALGNCCSWNNCIFNIAWCLCYYHILWPGKDCYSTKCQNQYLHGDSFKRKSKMMLRKPRRIYLLGPWQTVKDSWLRSSLYTLTCPPLPPPSLSFSQQKQKKSVWREA